MQRSILIIGAITAPILFCAGLLVGRQFPAHHYERFGTSVYLYDTSTGRVCTIKHPQSMGDLWAAPAAPASSGAATPPPGFVLDSAPTTAPASSEYPVCGE